MGRQTDFRNTAAKLLRCNNCGFEQTIRRKKSKNQKAGHQKHLWCIQCKDKTAHTELTGF